MKKREIRKFIVMIMGIILLVSEVQLFSGDNVYASTRTSRYEQLYVPSYAAMSTIHLQNVRKKYLICAVRI